MKSKIALSFTLIMFLFVVSLIPVMSSASTPTLTSPPASLPAVTYYVNGTATHYTITTSEWQDFFSTVIDNKSFVKYNWSANVTQDLIIFDLSYTGLNPYGSQLIVALSQIGGPSNANFSKAFRTTQNATSLVTSGGSQLSNIQALNSGAYPGFSWSKPKVTGALTEYRNIAIIVAIFAAVFVLYFYFNRKR